MTKYFTNNFSIINLYKKPSIKSEIVTQMLYGDSFSVSKKTQKWLKINIKEDNYKGFIQSKNFSDYIKPTHKVNILKAKIYKFPNKKKINELPFGSKIRIMNSKKNFCKFLEGWINKKDIRPISFKQKNPFKNITLFRNIKYKWGGKSFKGIDCSGLVQICLNFNNIFCPRDAKDQVKYFKKNINLRKIKKNDILYWKGHVAVALSNKQLIHAYGPLKKTVIMDINDTVKRIKRTAKLNLDKIKRI
ncbi:NlpC/P60 family protein [Pelagibacteraceae bacterium]|jgi:cell wall-associated NlpC family hydrolase|nr:C40 family peptidase [Pelagibacteraceae bacterium]MDC0529826.1 C40 family peptidase [Pelagibacteraceae bacterium]MDC0952392.1 NlpC/P60 family protein [Pelagibacteraceae bacterium]